MTNKLTRWGLLGTSFISETMVSAIQASSSSEALAIASRTQENANRFADRFSIPKRYSDFDALLADNDIDVVYIGLPNHLHKEWIIRAAIAGKHILCEKPLVLTSEEAQEVTATVHKHNVICMEGLMYRSHPLTKKLESLLDSNTIGDAKLYQATYTANIANLANPTAGGSIRNLGCYPVSLIRLLTKAEPTEIRALGTLDPATNNDTHASIMMKFPYHAMATVTTSDSLEMFWQFEIHGTQGHLKVITNPWLPTQERNIILIKRHDEADVQEINVTANQPLFTYQVDVMRQRIVRQPDPRDAGITLADSAGNVAVLEKWIHQIQTVSE
tara:strand:- start:204 stop:1190 length:987 start_codon:yes stop_codon:yes gene_type:complete